LGKWLLSLGLWLNKIVRMGLEGVVKAKVCVNKGIEVLKQSKKE